MLLVRAEATSSKSPASTSSPPSSVVIPSAQADGLMTIGDAGLRATLPSQEAALQRTACPRTASMPSRSLPAGGPTTYMYWHTPPGRGDPSSSRHAGGAQVRRANTLEIPCMDGGCGSDSAIRAFTALVRFTADSRHFSSSPLWLVGAISRHSDSPATEPGQTPRPGSLGLGVFFPVQLTPNCAPDRLAISHLPIAPKETPPRP
jgi:hypothetical protein